MKFRYSCVALLCAGRSAELRHAPGRRAGAVATRGDGRGDESEAGTAAGGVRKEEAASDIEEQQKLVDAGVDPRGVTFVPVNFELQNWVDELCKHGFKLATPTLVLWEGVTMYLTPAAVDACMKDFQRLAPTSVIAFGSLLFFFLSFSLESSSVEM